MKARIPTIVFCADDFGSDESIDDAILELAASGKIGAVSVLVSSTRFSEQRLRALLRTGVEIGLHLALTDTCPVSAALAESDWLVSGEFLPHWRDLQRRLLFSAPPAARVYGEWQAQFDKLSALTNRISYVDSHQNLHLLPHFFSPMQQLLNAHRTLRVRVFYDRARFLSPIRSSISLIGRALYRGREQSPTWGLYASGALTFSEIQTAVRQIRARGGIGYIVTHPGISDAPFPALRYTLNWRSEYELIRSRELDDFLARSD